MIAYVELLKSTRAEIVRLLKHRGELASGELAEVLGISTVAVRRHLDQLEQQGLVSHDVRHAENCERGRPQHRFSLTEQGDGLFPDRSASFACDILSEVERAFGTDAVRRLLAERTDATIASLRSEIAHLSFEERVRALASRFDDLGFVTEVVPLGDGAFKVVEHNCPTRSVAERFPVVCDEEMRLYEAAIGSHVSRVCHIAEGGRTCEYRLESVSHPRQLRVIQQNVARENVGG